MLQSDSLNSIRTYIGRILLPGTIISQSNESSFNLKFALGPGLKVVEPWEREYYHINEKENDSKHLVVTKPGVLKYKSPNLIWVDIFQKQYVPMLNDMVLGTVVKKTAEIFLIEIGTSNQATLPYTSFEGSTKRNRPDVKVGDIIYGKLSVADKDMEPELSCVDDLGKSNGMGLIGRGEQNCGFVFCCSLNLCQRLLDSKNSNLLQKLGQLMPYEIIVGANGRFWLSSPSTKQTIALANAIIASESMDSNQTRNMIKSLGESFSIFR